MSTCTLLFLVLASRALAWNCTAPAGEVGAVFAMTNAFDNQVIAFSRDDNGRLTEAGHYPTGGHGQGADLDADYGLALGPRNEYLYAVNPVSDTISVFSVNGSCLEMVQTVYAGDQPVGITFSSTGFAYALDQSVATPGIFGFSVGSSSGWLTPLTNKTIPNSTPIGYPGTVVFSPDGSALIVTNKVGDTLDVFSVDEQGMASSTPVSTVESAGLRPFGAAFGNDSTLYIAESGLRAFGNAAVSTYTLTSGPGLTSVTRSARSDQTDACWIVVTPDNRFVYIASFVTGAISSYTVGAGSTVSLLDGSAALPGNTSQPVDLGISADGRFMYNLLRGAGAVVGWEIQNGGSLTQVGDWVGQDSLPFFDGASGLAVF